MESGEEAAARLRRAARRRQRGYGGRGVGWRAERRLWSLSAEETRSPFEKTQPGP